MPPGLVTMSHPSDAKPQDQPGDLSLDWCMVKSPEAPDDHPLLVGANNPDTPKDLAENVVIKVQPNYKQRHKRIVKRQ